MSPQKTVIVTGASRGLGLNTVRTLVESDHAVIAISRQNSEALAKLIAAHPNLIRFIDFDLSNPENITSHWFHKIVTIQNPIHGLINNAAMAYEDLVTNIQLAELDVQFRVNVISPMLLTKFAIRSMLLHKINGSIVHVSSISAHTGYKGLAMYAATKGAIEAFSKNTAREWGAREIRSNCVVPGFMETDMSSDLDAKTKNRIYKRTALNQPTSIQSVTETILFLLSNRSKSITGQNIIVDSGNL